MSAFSILLITIQLFLVVQCGGKKVKKSKVTTPIILPTAILEHSEEYNDDTEFDVYIKDREQILSTIDFKLGDPIVLDSPRRFIQISILFTLSQNANYYKISKKNRTDEELGNYMNKQRENFYKRLGIPEEVYIKYGVDHGQEIITFLEENPEFEQAYNATMAQITD